MSAIELKVPEFMSSMCPHCFYMHDDWEGSSEMWSDRCMIWCHMCGMPYYYLIETRRREPDWEV
jgi:hypothetical protein